MTLVELLLVILIVGLLFGSLAGTFVTGFDTWNAESPRIDLLHSADLVLMRMSREPKLATRVTKAEPLEFGFLKEKGLCAGTDQGVFLYDGAPGTWEQINGTAPDTIPGGVSVLSILGPLDGRLLGAASDGSVYYSDDLGASWNAVKLGDSTEVRCLLEAADGSAIYAGTANKGDVYKSTDGGLSWGNTANLIDAGAQEAVTVYSLAEDSGGNIFAATDGTGSANIFKSADGGASWAANAISSIPPDTWVYRKSLTVTNQTASALTDYQVMLDISIIAGKMNSDFSDLRFTDGRYPETGGDYDYWTASYVADASAVIFVNIPSIAALGSVTLYMYYGNASAGSNSDDAIMDFMEVGKYKLRKQNNPGQWRGRVSFDNSLSFTNPVTIAQPDYTYAEADELVLRIRNVTTAEFRLKQQEPSNRNDKHKEEWISWMAVDAGTWITPDGKKIEAGILANTTANMHKNAMSPASVSFTYSLSNPVVFSQMMTCVEPILLGVFAKTRQRNVTGTSFQVGMENEELSLIAHGTETVGWIAFESGTGTWDMDSSIQYEIGVTPDSVTHNWYTLTFAGSYSSEPFFTAWMQTRDGGDSSELRCRNLTSASVQFFVEEDTTADGETGHTTEVAGYIVVGQTGILPIAKYVSPEPAVVFGAEEFLLTIDTDITALSIARTGSFYAGTEDGDVYKSTTGGESWSQTGDLALATYVYSLADNWRGYIFAATVRVTGAVFRSTDEGANWTVPAPIPADQVRTLGTAVDQTLLTGTGTGGLLFRTVDSGSNWSALPAVPGVSNVYSAIPVFESVKYSWSGTPYFPGEDPANRLVRAVFGTASAVGDGYLTSLDFRYFRKNGTELTPAQRATQSGRDTIAMISISLTLTLDDKTVSKATAVYLSNNRSAQ